MAVWAGDHQIGLEGYALNARPAVRIVDAGGQPLAGVPVTFTVTAGGGSVTAGAVATNGAGVAQVGAWIVGGSPGTNTLSAAAAGVSGSPVAFTATAQAEAYPIQLLNIGPPLSAASQAALDSAVAKWERVVYQSPGAYTLNVPAGQACGLSSAPAINQTVAGLLILVQFDSIDGPGNVLAQAAPCYARTSNGLTVAGLMEFDTADVAGMARGGTLGAVVLHEMAHVIGFGTLWNQTGHACLQLASDPPGLIQDTYFSCLGGTSRAGAEFDSIGGASYTGSNLVPPGGHKVPVENCGANTPSNCGAGTANSHWREPVFGNELMTGYVNSGANPLSVVTIASLGDLGYGVNYAAADPYSHTFYARAPSGGGTAPLSLGDDVRRAPLVVLDAAGRVVRVERLR